MTPMRGCAVVLAVLALLAHPGRGPAADKPTTGTFDASGLEIAYTVQGKGEPVILIHGWLSSGWINWDLPGTTNLLAKDHQSRLT